MSKNGTMLKRELKPEGKEGLNTEGLRGGGCKNRSKYEPKAKKRADDDQEKKFQKWGE